MYNMYLISKWTIISENVFKLNHMERKVPKYKNHKLGERKVKTLTRN